MKPLFEKQKAFFFSWKMDALLLVVISLGGWFWLIGPSHPDYENRLADDNRVVMYSLLRCPKCWAMKAKLAAAGIDYEEVRLDEESPEVDDFRRMLAVNNVDTDVIGTPTILVNDVLLLNAPSFEQVTEHLLLKPE